jgi:hypothetical protein
MIVVFGSVNLDLVARVARLPLPGETITGSAFAALPGGKGANQALAARYVATLNRFGTESVTRVEFVVAGRKKSNSAVPGKQSRSKRA